MRLSSAAGQALRLWTGVGRNGPRSRCLYGWGRGGPGGDLLFRGFCRSTIGAEGFHGRVRDGIGCMAPRHGHQAVHASSWAAHRLWGAAEGDGRVARGFEGEVSGWRLPLGAAGALGARGGKPIERLVPLGSTGCPAFTCGLSTWWSSTALGETWF